MLTQLLKKSNYHNLFVIGPIDSMLVNAFLLDLENGGWYHLDRVAAFIGCWLV